MSEPRSRWGSRVVVIGLLAGSLALGTAQPANAACHAFAVEVAPATAAEGTVVKVTVSRDAGVGPSQIDVETVDGSARGGSDYQAVPRRTVSFARETSQSFDVATTDDGEAESSETFKLHLSNPGGCAVNPNFVVGPDAVVTVTDNDASSSTRAPSTVTTAPSTSRSTVTTSASTTSAVGAVSTTSSSRDVSISSSSTTSDDDGLAAADRDGGDDDDGVPTAAALLALVVVATAAGAAAWAWRRRSSPG